MDKALEPEANARRKGLSVLMLTHRTTGKARLVGVAFKKNSADRGVMLNSCPWCGAEILWEKDTGGR